MKRTALSIALLFCGCGGGSDEPEPVAPEGNVSSASDMGAWTDEQWDAKPAEGKGNLRLLVTLDGKPLQGEAKGMKADFRLHLRAGGGMSATAFSPNAKGRYVYTDLRPATYTVEIRSIAEKYQDWKREGVSVAAGASPIVEVDLKPVK